MSSRLSFACQVSPQSAWVARPQHANQLGKGRLTMPRAPIEKKRLHYNNGEHLPHRPPYWERGERVNGKIKAVPAPLSRKTPCRVGW